MSRPLDTGTVSYTIDVGLRYPRCNGGPQGQSEQERKVSLRTMVSWFTFRNRREDNIKMKVRDIGGEYVN